MSLPILIYTGPGTEPDAFNALKRMFRLAIPTHHTIISVDSDELITRLQNHQCDLLVMPGGRDLPYCKALSGEPNRLIRKFVQEGGKYLGICAGAYYGSREVLFELNGPLEVQGSRELCFFPGPAIGPAYGLGLFEYDSLAGARPAKISWKGGETSIFYNGGCYFHNAHHFSEYVEILGRYNDIPEQPAAIVGCRFGKGKALLCGVHPEVHSLNICPQKSLTLFTYLTDWLL